MIPYATNTLKTSTRCVWKKSNVDGLIDPLSKFTLANSTRYPASRKKSADTVEISIRCHWFMLACSPPARYIAMVIFTVFRNSWKDS